MLSRSLAEQPMLRCSMWNENVEYFLGYCVRTFFANYFRQLSYILYEK